MNNLIRSHLISVAKCPIFLNSCNTPCEKIVAYQHTHNKTLKQIPEPWNGDIENAKILFISSNPSIDFNEHYPTSAWTEDQVADFFVNRFSKQKRYVKNYLYPLQTNGSYLSTNKWVRYWAAIRKLSKTLLDKENIEPGFDYAITEVVRCKSHKEIGVNEAMNTCSERFLLETLSLSNAKVFVVVGKKAKQALEERFQVEIPEASYKKIKINEVERMILSIPHPNARGEKSLEKLFSPEIIKAVTVCVNNC